MKAIDYLNSHAKKLDIFLNVFFTDEKKDAVKISPLAEEMMSVYRKFMKGKGIRGCLTQLGYECFGGRDKKAILSGSAMVEIAHSWILMHDDVMDQDTLRRGQPTVHVRYQKYHQTRYSKGNSSHYGVCMAINLSEVGIALSYLILANSNFADEVKTKVLRRFDQQILTTAFGQNLDVNYELKSRLTENDVLRIHHYKTANYTITGPLQYGALFAGASESKVEKIEKYGLPVGIAFQLRDDELGLFSNEKVLGKPIGSDVKENKNTILKIKALENANKTDRDFLESAYGNRGITPQEVRKVREITLKTGALAYSQKLSRQLVEKGKKHIKKITSDPKHQDMLYKMADLMIERES